MAETITRPEQERRRVQRLMDINAAAVYLDVSVAYLYKAVQRRAVPVTRIGRNGRTLRFDPVALDKFIARKTTAAR